MTNPENPYSQRYEIELGRVYDKIARHPDFKRICGEDGDSLLVRGDSKNLIIIQRDFNNRKEIIKIHSEEPEIIQSKLESITGVDFSKYRIHEK